MPSYLLLALFSAVFYSTGGLLNKQAMAKGGGPLRIYITQAWFGALLLSPFLFIGEPVPLSLWWQPALPAFFAFAGTVIYVLTLRDGDFSIIGPIAGIKPVFNALLIFILLRTAVPVSTWLACGMAAAALFVMRTPSSDGSHSFRRTALQTLAAVFLFALTETCVQRWAPIWGAFRFPAFMFLGSGIFSLSLLFVSDKKLLVLPREARLFCLVGSFLCCLPGILIGIAVGKYGHGAEVNIAYSLHVLITLALVWCFGRHIGNVEHMVGHKVFLRRLAGALILLTAIVLIIF
jgi:uncharacterized membrane protein